MPYPHDNDGNPRGTLLEALGDLGSLVEFASLLIEGLGALLKLAGAVLELVAVVLGGLF